jgi:streptogramin lyase
VGLLALAGAVAAVLLLAGDDGATPERTATTRTAPAGAPVPGEPLLVGRRPNAITFAAGQLWIASSANGDLALVDARLGERTDFVEVGAGATSVDAGSGSVWVAKASTGTLLKIDARTRRRTGPAIRMQAPGRPVAVATGEGAVWVGVRNAALGYRGPESVVRVSPRTGAQQTITVPGGVQDLAVGRGAVWVTNRFRDSVVRISASTGAQREIPVGDTPKGVAVGEDGVWVASEADDVVTRINPRTRRTSRIRLEYSPERVAVGGGSVWVAARAAGRLIRIDPERRRVRGSVRTGRRPFALAVTRDSVWVTLLGEDAVQRVRFRR